MNPPPKNGQEALDLARFDFSGGIDLNPQVSLPDLETTNPLSAADNFEPHHLQEPQERFRRRAISVGELLAEESQVSLFLERSQPPIDGQSLGSVGNVLLRDIGRDREKKLGLELLNRLPPF